MEPKARRHPNVAHLEEVEPRTLEHGNRFACTMKLLGRATGSTRVSCTHYEVPPGRTAFPRHYHAAMEEAIFVLGGTGTLRIGESSVDISAGDYVTFPCGPDHAHQLVNTGADTL